MSWLSAALLLPLFAAQSGAPPAETEAGAPPDAEPEIPARPGTEVTAEAVEEAEESAPAAAGDTVSREEFERLEGRLADVTSRLEALEQSEMDDVALEDARRQLEIYGFFDLTFAKYFADEDSFFGGLVNDSSTFFVQNLNLYLSSEMTDTLSALAEIKFSFLPLGVERTLEVPGMVEYEREDTTVTEPYHNSVIRYGSIVIERVHLTWRPADWLGVTAGRFLTPYGIWNIDHGTPVLIGVRPPYLQVGEYMPQAQTGLQVFGRFFPGNNTYLDYAITASNGRGPIESVLDLDENKALGLRLRFSYEGLNGRFALGGYGFFGDYSDQKRVLQTIDPFRVEIETTEKYTELSGSLDLLLELHGFRLQAEYARGKIEYSVRPLRSMYRGIGYQPDFVRQDFYFLLGYELPLRRWLGSMTIMPYLMSEYSNGDDSVADLDSCVAAGGINFKPSPFVVLKVEYSWVSLVKRENSEMSVINAQMAVSF